jgi:hypothetical protein
VVTGWGGVKRFIDWLSESLVLNWIALGCVSYAAAMTGGDTTLDQVLRLILILMVMLSAFGIGMLSERRRSTAFAAGYMSGHMEVNNILVEFGQRIREGGENLTSEDLRQALNRSITMRVSHDDRFKAFRKSE